MAKENPTRFRRLLRALDLPQEIDLHVPKFTMLGTSDLLVENHTGILQYSDTLVRLMTPEGIVRITGHELTLTEFGSERVYLRGRIDGWQYEERI
ncbi:MAG: YabP/YqfC family sporulation protein [Clostridia bacterium]